MLTHIELWHRELQCGRRFLEFSLTHATCSCPAARRGCIWKSGQKRAQRRRGRGEAKVGERKWQRKTSEKCFTLIFCEWRKESVESRTLTWGTAWLNLSRRFSRLLTNMCTRTHAHTRTHPYSHTQICYTNKQTKRPAEFGT